MYYEKMNFSLEKEKNRGGILVGGIELFSLQKRLEELIESSIKENPVMESKRGKRWIRIFIDKGKIRDIHFSLYLYIFEDKITLSTLFINPVEKDINNTWGELVVPKISSFLKHNLNTENFTFFEKTYKFVTGPPPLGLENIGRTKRILFSNDTFWVREMNDETFYDFLCFCHREYVKNVIEKKLEKLYSLLNTTGTEPFKKEIIEIITWIKKEKRGFYKEFSFDDEYFFFKKEEEAKFLLHLSLIKSVEKRNENLLNAVQQMKEGLKKTNYFVKDSFLLLYLIIGIGFLTLSSFPLNVIAGSIAIFLTGFYYFKSYKKNKDEGD